MEIVFRTRKVEAFWKWYFKYYQMTAANSPGYQGVAKYRGYLKNACYVIADLDIPEKVIVKGTQLGLTHVLNGFAIWCATERGRSVAFYIVNDGDVDNQSTGFLASSIAHMPAANQQLLNEDINKKDETNTNKIRYFKKGSIRTLGSKSPSNYDAFSCTDIVMDEYSRMPKRIGVSKDDSGESPFDRSKSRMHGVKIKNHIVSSSPEQLGLCQTTELFEEAQIKLSEWVECSGCHEHIIVQFGSVEDEEEGETKEPGLRWDRIETPDGERDNKATAETARYECSCGHSMSHRELCEQDNLTGELRSQDGSIKVDVENDCYLQRDPAGDWHVIDKPFRVGLRLNSLLSPTNTFFHGVKDYLDGVDDIKIGSDSKMQAVVKKYMATAYERIADSMGAIPYLFIKSKYENYQDVSSDDESQHIHMPDQVQMVSGWWDLQNHWIQGLYCGHGYGDEMWILKNMKRVGDPETTNSLDAVLDMMSFKFRKPNGTYLTPRLTGIDSGDRPTIAYSKSLAWGRTRVIPTKGSSAGYEKQIATFPAGPKPSCQGTYMTEVGTIQAKDSIFRRLSMVDQETGEMIVPRSQRYPHTRAKRI